MLKRYDAGLSIFGTVIDNKVNAWARTVRASLMSSVIPEMGNIHTFLSIDTTSIAGYQIGVTGLCKSNVGLTIDCEFCLTFLNLDDNSTFVLELSTSRGYEDQCGFSDKLDIFNTNKWLRFVTADLPSYVPTKENTLLVKGTAVIEKA